MNYDEVEAKRRRKRAPPILLRRRLSAPETIMRKHVLAQQRSSSQDSHKSSDSDSNTGSDSNLSKRRNPDIRRSTLMKRFWESSRGNLNISSFPASYAEWQYGGYRNKGGSTRSLMSDSPKHARSLPTRQSRRHLAMPVNLQPQSPSEVTYTSFATNAPKSEEDSYVVYSSTDHTARTDASDPYPVSTPTESVNNNSSSPAMAPTTKQITHATKAYRINDNGISDVTNKTDIPELPIKYQFVINERQNKFEFVPQDAQSPEGGKTNLNVITNVQLSQSTLNTIFNQVMQDVLQSPPVNAEVVDENITKQKAYNFKLNINDTDMGATSKDNGENEDCKGASHCLNVENEETDRIGEINVGCPYKAASPVPRLSALPRTSSMEVNISSNDSLDKDSDTSLVDSLDDPSSPRLRVKRQTNINITKEKILSTNFNDSQVLEDEDEVIEKEEIKKTIQKSSVFYIPIDDSNISESDSPQVVSDMLPNKLKERLLHRQLKREEKRMQERMKAFDVENGNASSYLSTSPETTIPSRRNVTKTTRKTKQTSSKTLLPQIDLTKDYNKSLRSNYTQRSLNRYREAVETANNRKSFMLPKTHPKQSWHNQHTHNQKLSQGQKAKPKSSSTSAKHIEILEIMEIVEPERAVQLTPKTKSRIPVFQHSASTKLPKLKPKPTFLDFGEVGQPGDPKLDQLIANILIDTLNHEDIKDVHEEKRKDQMQHAQTDSELSQGPGASKEQSNINNSNNNPCLIGQAADILTKQVLDNNNMDGPKTLENVDLQQLDAEDIPKGWITFYMLQKAQSPESTSDEGEDTAKTATKGTQYDRGYGDGSRVSGKSDYDKVGGNAQTGGVKDRRKLKSLSGKQDGWSVTFNNNGDVAPEVEMKFRFPSLGSEHRGSKMKGEASKSPALKFEDVCGPNYQSEIYKSKQYLRNPSTIKVRRRQITLSPRPTKTSKQRTMLHRQRHVHNPSEEHADIPQILSITGSGLSQLRRLPRMSEILLKRLISKLHSQQGVESTKEAEAKAVHD